MYHLNKNRTNLIGIKRLHSLLSLEKIHFLSLPLRLKVSGISVYPRTNDLKTNECPNTSNMADIIALIGSKFDIRLIPPRIRRIPMKMALNARGLIVSIFLKSVNPSVWPTDCRRTRTRVLNCLKSILLIL